MTKHGFTLPKRARLTNRREIAAVLGRPRSRIVRRSFEIRAAPNGLKISRLGVIVGRAFDRRSTRRNCFKRCAREAYRLRQKRFKNVDILIRAKTMTDQGVIRQQMNDAFDELSELLDASHPEKEARKQAKRTSRKSLAVRSLLGLITLYRLVLSPLFGARCRFYPTCSHYAMEAVTQWGALRGLVMTAKRLFKCQPFHPGGYDPVPAPGRAD